MTSRGLEVCFLPHYPTRDLQGGQSLILLGIHTSLKEDLHCAAAELVYGTTLRFLGEHFVDSITYANISDISRYVTKLKLIMQHLKAIPMRSTANR